MTNEDLGFAIRQARERLGMTQERLAELVQRDQRAISEYENGKRRLPAIDLPVFARVLQVSLLDFFTADVSESDFQAALLEQFQKLDSPSSKKAAIEMMRVYSEAIKDERHIT